VVGTRPGPLILDSSHPLAIPREPTLMTTDAPGLVPTFVAAWAIVAAAALPVAGVLWLLAGRRPVFPRWRVVPFRGTLLDWLLLYGVYLVVMSLGIAGVASTGWLEALTGRAPPPLVRNPAVYETSLGGVGGAASAAAFRRDAANAGQLRQMAASLIALPALLAAAGVLRRVVHDARPGFDWRSLPGDVARGAVAGVVLTPAVHAVYWLAKTANAALGGVEQEHPLAEGGVGDSPGGVALFLLAVCVVVPWIEELLFRGVLMRWLGRRASNAGLVFAVALLFAATRGVTLDPQAGPVGFVAVVALGTAAHGRRGAGRPHARVRTVRAVLATSALFAAAHSAVWPSPVPLFVLACGLGTLTVRTGRITAAVVAHGLFNAVSAAMLLRAPAG